MSGLTEIYFIMHTPGQKVFLITPNLLHKIYQSGGIKILENYGVKFLMDFTQDYTPPSTEGKWFKKKFKNSQKTLKKEG